MSSTKKDSESNATKLFKEYEAAGDRLVAEGDYELAREKYRKALLFVPENLSVRHKTAELLLQIDCKQDALCEYQFIASKALAISTIILDQLKNEELEARRAGEASAKETKQENGESAAPPTFFQVPLFSDLPPAEFLEVLKNLDVVLVKAGEKFITEGEVGDSMFILITGRVDVLRESVDGPTKNVAELGEGSLFGEMALVAETPRLASVVAATDCTLLKISRDAYLKIIEQYPNVGEKIKWFHKERLLKSLLYSSPVFNKFNDETIHGIVERFVVEHVVEGTVLLRQGQEGDGFHLLLRGTCGVSATDKNNDFFEYPDLVEGDFFGEISLLLRIPVTATVIAKKDSVILKMTQSDFDELISPNSEVLEEIAKIAGERLMQTVSVTNRTDLTWLLL
jgi:cAMP-dependent protein kinase regulator